MKHSFRASLVVRQVLVVLAAGVLLGTTLGFLQLRADLVHDRERFATSINSLLRTAANPASLAAYELDPAQAEEVADGLVMYPGIREVTIVDDFGRVLARAHRTGHCSRVPCRACLPSNGRRRSS